MGQINLNIELTSNCNATCPGCSRHNNIEPIPKNNIITLDMFKSLINEVLDDIRRLHFDGSFGDSAQHKDFIPMIKYITDIAPWVQIRIATNGSFKNASFWKELGVTLSPVRHSVHFALDGIDNETQNMYRVGTNYDKIITNAKAFISGGGTAAWKMIPFKFNIDLEEQAKKLAQEYGFTSFQRNRVTRYNQKALKLIIADKMNIDNVNDAELELMDPDITKKSKIDMDNKIGHIEIDNNLDLLLNYETILESKSVECKWKAAHEYMISHDGTVWQCCWHDANYHYAKANVNDKNMYDFFTSKYPKNWNNIYHNKFFDIINSPFFTEDLPESFDNTYDDPFNPKLKICSDKCSIL